MKEYAQVSTNLGKKWKDKLVWIAEFTGMSQTAILRRGIDILEAQYLKEMKNNQS